MGVEMAAVSWHRQLHQMSVVRMGKSLARRMIDGCIERALGINCRASALPELNGHYNDAWEYEPCDYPFLLRCLSVLELQPDDVVFDIGCGMGRALCLLARRRIARCVGIELSPELAAGAEANLRSLRGARSPAEVRVVDAAFADYSDATAFYTFNPFGDDTMRAVLERIAQTRKTNPRPIRMIYLNPFHEHILEESGWLKRVREVRAPWSNTFASYWVSK